VNENEISGCNTHEEVRNEYRILVGKAKGKKSLVRPRRSWEFNIKLGPKETGSENVDWIQLLHYKFCWRSIVNTVMKLQATFNFCRRTMMDGICWVL